MYYIIYGSVQAIRTYRVYRLYDTNRALAFRLRLPRGICIGGRDRQMWAWSTFIRAHYLLSAYFLAVYRYKRMRLISSLRYIIPRIQLLPDLGWVN